MRRIAITALVVVAVGAALGVALMRSGHAPAPARPAAQQPRAPVAPRPAPSPATADDQAVAKVRAALQDLLHRAAEKPSESPFPQGTRLIDLRLEGDRAVIDLSPEFGDIATQGNTTESAAQWALRSALARCPGVRRMRVLLGGKLFEGEHSGPWDDVPVRDETGRRP